MRAFKYLVFSCILLVLAGCGSTDDTPELGEVSGIVTLDGAPVPNAKVSFYPKSGGREGIATTDENGFYELNFGQYKAGAVIGENIVRITTLIEPEFDDNGTVIVEGTPELIPEQYNANTTLTIDVQAGKQDIALELITSK